MLSQFSSKRTIQAAFCAEFRLNPSKIFPLFPLEIVSDPPFVQVLFYLYTLFLPLPHFELLHFATPCLCRGQNAAHSGLPRHCRKALFPFPCNYFSQPGSGAWLPAFLFLALHAKKLPHRREESSRTIVRQPLVILYSNACSATHEPCFQGFKSRGNLKASVHIFHRFFGTAHPQRYGPRRFSCTIFAMFFRSAIQALRAVLSGFLRRPRQHRCAAWPRPPAPSR